MERIGITEPLVFRPWRIYGVVFLVLALMSAVLSARFMIKGEPYRPEELLFLSLCLFLVWLITAVILICRFYFRLELSDDQLKFSSLKRKSEIPYRDLKSVAIKVAMTKGWEKRASTTLDLFTRYNDILSLDVSSLSKQDLSSLLQELHRQAPQANLNYLAGAIKDQDFTVYDIHLNKIGLIVASIAIIGLIIKFGLRYYFSQ